MSYIGAGYSGYEYRECPLCRQGMWNGRCEALAFSAEIARQERTIADLRQQLSFMQQALRDAGV